MDDRLDNFDSPEAIREMRSRHLRLGLQLQEFGLRGLLELRERGDLSAEECKQLLDAGMKLEQSMAGPTVSRRRH